MIFITVNFDNESSDWATRAAFFVVRWREVVLLRGRATMPRPSVNLRRLALLTVCFAGASALASCAHGTSADTAEEADDNRRPRGVITHQGLMDQVTIGAGVSVSGSGGS